MALVETPEAGQIKITSKETITVTNGCHKSRFLTFCYQLEMLRLEALQIRPCAGSVSGAIC